MRFYTHIPAGLLLYTILIWVFNQPYTLAGVLVIMLFSVLPDLIDKVTGEHRGWGHSVIWLIPIAVLFAVKIQLGLACFSAFSMHILLDAVTKTGVPFLYPFSKTRMVMPKKEKSRIQTGSKQETALCIVIVLLLIPLTYCVLFGVPGDLFSAVANTTKNKTGNNSTALKNLSGTSGYGSGSSGSGSSKYSNSSSPLSSLSKDLKSSGSSGSSGTSGTSSGSTNSTDDTSDGLVDWLDQDLSDSGGNSNSDTSNTQTDTNNQTSNSNNDNSNSDSSNSDGYVSDASPIVDYSLCGR